MFISTIKEYRLRTYLRHMLTEKEEAFLKYWEANRERLGKTGYQIITGLPFALLCGFGYWGIMEMLVYLNVFPRAGMKFNAASTYGNTIFVGIAIFAIFFSFFSKKFRWENRENMYKEFLAKKVNHPNNKTEQNENT